MATLENLTEQFRKLPVSDIASAVNVSLSRNPRLVVTAPPGAGKSTLLPLTLLSSLPEGKIIMLEPRRLAARQVALRMAEMLGERAGDTVGYRVRFESRVSRQTRIEVVTEGVMERLLTDDPTLDGVSAVIFDEFHERSLSSDTSLALTLEAQNLLRPDLRLLIMSATIDAEPICTFLKAPHLKSEGRMYDVRIEYGEDFDPYLAAETVAKAVRKAHREEKGDILAFLPGQGEIVKCMEILGESLGTTRILPLYGMLPPEQQHSTLAPSRPGERKVVLATPIAETSLTIDGVRIVVDSGLYKTSVIDRNTGLSRLTTVPVSIDMARQRSGRAGRLCDGVCYRLWSKAAESRMPDCRRPEILDADLAGTILEIAAWGENNPERLPWLTPPPAWNLSQGKKLLTALGAINEIGGITTHGKRLASLPCHPRIANMLVSAGSEDARALACDIAAILEDKDPLNDEKNADINTRIAELRQRRSGRRLAGRWRRIGEAATQYRRITGTKEYNGIPGVNEAGRLIALAFPERIAQRQEDGGYRLAGGDFVQLDRDDDLGSCAFLAVASAARRIHMAAPLSEENAKNMGIWRTNVSWDSRAGKIVARKELRAGALIICSSPIVDEITEECMEAVCRAAKKEGRTMFDFNDGVRQLQSRIVTLADWHPELGLPEVDVDSVLGTASEWLPMYCTRPTCVADLRRIDMTKVIFGMLSYEQQTALERLAPAHIKLPSGRNARVDYRVGADAPVVSARLQDCFGMQETPRLDGGQRPVLMELLSPGYKPVQLTKDMRGFWANTYFEVRKELRRRYPKHKWPDNPDEFGYK